MKNYLLFSILVLFSIGSCTQIEDLDSIKASDFNPEFAVPLIQSEVSLLDLLENLDDGTFLIVDPDGTIRLNYKGNLVTTTSLDVFKAIQDDLDDLPNVPFFDTLIALPIAIPDSIDLDFMKMSQGIVPMVMQNSTEPDTVSVTVEFVNATKDGETLKTIQKIGPGQSVLDTLFLEDYFLTPDNDSIYVRYDARRVNGERIVPFPILISIQDVRFSYAEGYFAQIKHEVAPDTIEIEFFEDWTRGDIWFDNPEIKIYIKNSFGIPTRSIVHYFNVLTVKRAVLPLKSPFIASGVDFAYPMLPDQVGVTTIDTFIFNKYNSNIDTILGSGPLEIRYDVDAITNADADTSIRGFATDSSKYEVQIEVDLPLHGRASGFVVRDTYDLNFDSYTDFNHAEFKLITENGIGLKVGTQGYFLDSLGNRLDSLFSEPNNIIEPAAVDMDGNVVQSTEKTTFINFDQIRFEKIKAAKQLLLHASFFTANEGDTSVKILSNQKLGMRMGMKVGL